jgi:hypothetical protein
MAPGQMDAGVVKIAGKLELAIGYFCENAYVDGLRLAR